MKLLAFGIKNFKSFYGEQSVSLPNEPGRTVYLFGGLNGAGKTSLAQATVLALHGERAAGLPGLFEPGRGARDRYQRWLAAAFNQSARVGADDHMHSWVRLHDGTATLTMHRTWWFDAAGHYVEEQFDVREDTGRDTVLYTGGEAQEIVDELLPRHLLDFAIFDGERVRRLDDTLSAPAVRSALDRLLNLDAVERTRIEVDRLARERRLVHANTAQLDEYADLSNRLADGQAARTETARRLAAAEDEQERMQRELDHLATSFDASLSATFTPGQLSADLISLRERRTNLRARLGRHLGDWLYLLPALPALPDLASQIAAQSEQRTGRDRLKLEVETIAALADDLWGNQKLRKDLGAEPIATFRAWLDAAANQRQGDLDVVTIESQTDALGQFSDADLIEVEAAITAAQRDLTDVVELADDLLRVDKRIREMELALATADQHSTTAQLLRRRDELNVLLGQSRATTEMLRTEVDQQDSDLALLRSSVAAVEARLSTSEDDEAWLATAEATVAALDEFLAEERAAASAAVRERMVTNLQTLLRKDNLVVDVRIDPLTHVTRLLAEDGSDVELPSAAEHQLAAMAFIDAVLASADSPIPVFVDTPLARLDSHHRRAVVRDFWPQLGRQVIVLSTDEEVVDDLLTFAQPSLAATYRIECNPEGHSTITTNAYLEAAAS